MDRKDVERFKRHNIVATQYVLISQQIGEIGRQGVTHALVLDLDNSTCAQLQPE